MIECVAFVLQMQYCEEAVCGNVVSCSLFYQHQHTQL